MDCSTPSLPVHHELPGFTQTHSHWVADAIQPPHPLSLGVVVTPTAFLAPAQGRENGQQGERHGEVSWGQWSEEMGSPPPTVLTPLSHSPHWGQRVIITKLRSDLSFPCWVIPLHCQDKAEIFLRRGDSWSGSCILTASLVSLDKLNSLPLQVCTTPPRVCVNSSLAAISLYPRDAPEK